MGFPDFDEIHTLHGVHESQDETELQLQRQSPALSWLNSNSQSLLSVASLHFAQADPKQEVQVLLLCRVCDKSQLDHWLHRVQVGSPVPEFNNVDGFPAWDSFSSTKRRFLTSLILVKADGYLLVHVASPPCTTPNTVYKSS